MTKSFIGLAALAAVVAVPASSVLVPARAEAAMPVFDATNYSQNLLQAARALEQINHQVTSLQNEAAMLETMARNLKAIDFPQLAKINSALQQIDGLMGKAKGIGFDVGQLDAKFRTMFPGAGDGALKTDQRVAGARARLESAMEGFRHSMAVQSEIVSNIRQDSTLLGELAARSQGATGALAVQQATNQLLALDTKQQLQLQDLLAADFRSQAIERARRAQGEADARASTTRFLGSGKAYSPNRN